MEIRAKNIGPAAGETLLGRADEPGMYFIVGHKAAGKSHFGRIFTTLRDSGALKSEAAVTDGETEAYIEFTPRRVTFTRGAAGDLREPVYSGEGEFPEIAALPPSIETLITGDNLKDSEARARRRLGALLSYAPISSSREVVEQLCSVMDDYSFAENEPELAGEWERLAEKASAVKKRFRYEPLRPANLIQSMLLEKPRRGVLEDHDFLVDLLNATANCGEKAAAVQANRVAELEGELKSQFSTALRMLGWEEERSEELKRVFRAEHNRSELEQALQEAREKLAGVRASHTARTSEELRRERLLNSRGEKPSTEEEERKVREVAQKRLEALEERERELGEWWSHFLAGVRDEEGAPRWGSSLELHAKEAEKLITRLDELLRVRSEDSPEMAEAQQDLRKAQGALENWRRIGAELMEPIDGASDEELEAAEREEEQAELGLIKAGMAWAYQATVSEKEEAVHLQVALAQRASDYRKAARESWHQLGMVVTEELKLPWLQVDGLSLYLGYTDTGKLNADPEVVRLAERRARAALARLSPVSPARFLLGRIREESAIEWRSLDDEKRVSTAELHEACLEVALSRRDKLGPMLWIDWQVMAAFDEESLLEFDSKVARAGMIVFSERPRRKGDPEELHLERVGNEDNQANQGV